ncbi:MAG: signal peptidase II [Bacteroidales bacterium]|jgi:signal peptidase II
MTEKSIANRAEAMTMFKHNVKAKKIFRILAIVLILVSAVGCDRISKTIVRRNLNYHERVVVIDNFITLVRVENTGAFLSLGNTLPKGVNRVLLIIFPLIVLGFAMYYLLTKSELSGRMITGLCLIIGGGIGNVYDRAVFGSVTDFMYMDFGLFRTGIFNAADVFIMAGMFLVLFDMLAKRTETKSAIPDR